MNDDDIKRELGEEQATPAGKQPSEHDKSLIRLALKQAKQWGEFHADNIKAAEDDGRFIIEGKQWPEGKGSAYDERMALGLPCLTFNRAPAFIDGTVGKIRKNLPRPKVLAVDSKTDPKLAEIVTELGRHVRRQSRAYRIYPQCVDQCATIGYPSFRRIVTDYISDDSDEQEIFIRFIPHQFSVLLDPSATVMGPPSMGGPKWGQVHETISKPEFQRRYPDSSWVSVEDATGDEQGWWMQDEVRIAEYFIAEAESRETVRLPGQKSVAVDGDEHKAFLLANPEEGKKLKSRKRTKYKVMRYVISGHEILEGPDEWPGSYIPIIPTYPKNQWFKGKQVFSSLYRWAKPAAQMRNYWASALTSNVALSEAPPYIGTSKQIGGKYAPQWENPKGQRAIMYEPDPLAPGRPQREAPAQISSGEVEMLRMAIDEEKALASKYDASLGARSNETSGIAIQSRDAQSDDVHFVYEDNLAESMEYEELMLIDLYPKVYDTHRVFRIYGEDGRDKGTVEINKPSGQFEQDETGAMVEKILNPMSEINVDVEVAVGPGPASKRAETAEMLTRMSSANPASAPAVMPLVAKSLDFEYADDLYKLLVAGLPPALQAILKGEDEDGKAGIQAQVQAGIEQFKAQVMPGMQKIEQDLQVMQENLQTAQQNLQTVSQEKAQLQQKVEAATMLMKDKVAEHQLEERKVSLEERRFAIEEKRAAMEDQKRTIDGNVVASPSTDIESVKAQNAELAQAVAGALKKLHEVIAKGADGKESQAIVKQIAELSEKITAISQTEKKSAENLTIVIDNKGGQVRKTVSLRSPDGKEYTGEVTEEQV